MKIKCPICNEELVKIDNVYRCFNRHNYDISKEGYINLLKKQGGKNFGDSPEMVKARRNFFNKDYYNPLKTRLKDIVSSYNPACILDLGSGEGYYTNYLANELNGEIIGIDIAKEAVKIAAKQNKDVTYIVGSVQDIPLYDKSVDLILNNFTPLDLKEINRVLKDKGILVTTKVGKNHLIELKEALYDEVYLNDNVPVEDENLKLLNSEVLKFKISLPTNEDITNLFMMTPYYHHTSLASKEKLKTLKSLEVTCEFNIDVYKKEV